MKTPVIKQITACALPSCYKNPTAIFGLGDDGKVYFWNDIDQGWILNIQKQ